MGTSNPPLPRDVTWLLGVAYLIGLVMLMTAGIYEGPLAEPALVLVLVAAAILFSRYARLLRRLAAVLDDPRVPSLVGLAGLAVFVLATLADRRLLTDAEATPVAVRAVLLFELVLLGTYVPAVLGRRAAPRARSDLRFALFTGSLLLAGGSVIAASPHPHIDVYTFHTEAARALLRGENPYRLEMPETGPTHLMFGFVYPPTAALLGLLGLVLAGDVRWATLTALVTAGAAMRFLARARSQEAVAPGTSTFLEDAPFLVLWLSPKALFFVEQCWNDVFPAAFFALGVLAHARARRRLAAMLFGVALSAKQTMVLLVPLMLLLAPTLVEWALFFGTAAILVVPLAAWDFDAFNRMVILLQGRLPTRADGLTPMNFLQRHFGVVPRGITGILTALVVLASAVLRAPRTRPALVLSLTTAATCFYVFNKWAFMNYYFFLTVLSALAAAALLHEGGLGRAAPTSLPSTG